MARKPRIAVLYHYLHPDDVISARHYNGLCTGLAERGWQVAALPANRGCRDESRRYPLREQWQGIAIHRIWRPRLPQATAGGRLLNAAWMQAAWAALAARPRRQRPDAVLIGTDPVLSVGLAPLFARRGLAVAHWVYDLYPEAAAADGLLDPRGRIYRAAQRMAAAGYRSCDLIADIGPCMKDRLAQYDHGASSPTLVPWALAEPAAPRAPDPELRRALFGEARLALLYSGNFGRAHAFAGLLALARKLRQQPLHFHFAIRGNRAAELRAAVTASDRNITISGYFPDQQFQRYLETADIHLASLRPAWQGLVVPSKFFGSLALGRPVLYDGPLGSSIASWIRDYEVGWLLGQAGAAEALAALAADPSGLERLQHRCHRIYAEHFARQPTLDRWDQHLRAIIPHN